MNLTSEESGLVFDCLFHCAEQERIDRGSALLSSNPKAAETYTCMRQALSQLKHMKDEDCPDELVHLTIARLKLFAVIKSLPHKNGSH